MTHNKHQPKKLYFQAFTLVELIVVIVILAILATIAFLSFNSYSSSSRDSVRLSDINSLNKSLELFNISAAKYPDPTNVYMTVVYSGGTIFEQGKLGDSVITAVQKMSKKPLDPLTDKEYVYSVNMTNTTYQLKADMESKPTTGYDDIDFFNNTYADGTGTVCFIKGNFNGLIEKTNTGNTNYILAVPGLIISDTGTLSSNTNVDYNTLSGKVLCNGYNYPCVINFAPTPVFMGSGNTLPTTVGDVGSMVGKLKEAYSGSNSAIANPVISNLLSATGANMISIGATLATKVGATQTTALTVTNYPTCNAPDIILDNGQIWSSCNVGTTLANTGVNNTATYGKYYQWGSSTNSWTNGNAGWNRDWQTPQKDGAWGGSVSDTVILDVQTNKSLRQGVCPNGRHIPSAKEWYDACYNFKGSACLIGGTSDSTTGAMNMITGLKMPFTGILDRTNGSLTGPAGSYAIYMSSSPISTNAQNIAISSTYVQVGTQGNRAWGGPVRCIAN